MEGGEVREKNIYVYNLTRVRRNYSFFVSIVWSFSFH